MPWPFSKKDKLAAPDQDPKRTRPSDPGVHNRGRRNESPGPGRSRPREHSAPNYHYSRNRSPEYRGRRNSSFDDAYRSGRGLPPPRNYPGGSPSGGNRMAIDMDPHGVQLKNADGSAIRMRLGGMDLTSAGGQMISVNTAGKNTCCGGGPCSHHQMPVCHHGAAGTYTCYDPACLAGPRVVPAVHTVPYQQTLTTYTTQPAIAPMAIAAAPVTPVVQIPAQGTMQNIGGVPVVIPVNPRRR